MTVSGWLERIPGTAKRLYQFTAIDDCTRIEHINRDIYVSMQWPSELGIRGTLADWDRSGDLVRITVPTLVIGAAHDTMDPAHMSWMADQLSNGCSLICPNGSHLAQYDDPDHYFPGLIRFIDEVDHRRAM